MSITYAIHSLKDNSMRRTKQMMWRPLVRIILTGFIKRVHSFHSNRRKGPWHWKGWEPLF